MNDLLAPLRRELDIMPSPVPEQPGLFRVLPTTIWNMYLPGEGANGASAVLEVVPGDS